MRLPSRGKARCAGATVAAALLLLACTAAFARQETSRPEAPRKESFDDLYVRGQRANAAIKTLTARFTETTTSSLLTRPLVSRGRLAVERPSRVVLRYSSTAPASAPKTPRRRIPTPGTRRPSPVARIR